MPGNLALGSGAVAFALGGLDRQLFILEPAGGHEAGVAKLHGALVVVLRAPQSDVGAPERRSGGLDLGAGAVQPRLQLAAAALVEQGRRGWAQLRHHRAGGHRVALAQGDARHPAS